MSKKANSSIYHFESYIQIQKLNCVLKMHFSNVEPSLRGEKIKTLRVIESRTALKMCCHARIFTVFTQREAERINV